MSQSPADATVAVYAAHKPCPPYISPVIDIETPVSQSASGTGRSILRLLLPRQKDRQTCPAVAGAGVKGVAALPPAGSVCRGALV